MNAKSSANTMPLVQENKRERAGEHILFNGRSFLKTEYRLDAAFAGAIVERCSRLEAEVFGAPDLPCTRR